MTLKPVSKPPLLVLHNSLFPILRMVIGNKSCDLPGAILFTPDINEFESGCLYFAILQMRKTVLPRGYGAITFDWVNFKAIGYQFASHLKILFEEIAKCHQGFS